MPMAIITTVIIRAMWRSFIILFIAVYLPLEAAESKLVALGRAAYVPHEPCEPVEHIRSYCAYDEGETARRSRAGSDSRDKNCRDENNYMYIYYSEKGTLVTRLDRSLHCFTRFALGADFAENNEVGDGKEKHYAYAGGDYGESYLYSQDIYCI